MSARAAAAIEIFEVEGGECTVSKTTTIDWYKRLDNGETSLEDFPRSGGRRPFMNLEALLKQVLADCPWLSAALLSSLSHATST